jgi:4-amino-4-deoxy-L-arabinose transferase-like glycosyltransferase
MRSFGAGLALVTAGAVTVRAVYVVASASTFPVGGDAGFYQFTGEHLAAGDGYVSQIKFVLADGELAPTAEHPPLFPVVLAGLIKLGANSTTAQRLLVACVVGAVVVVAVGLLGRRVAGERAGLIAAALAAFFPTIVTAHASLQSEPLYGLWLVLALLAAYRLNDRRDTASAIALGAAIGIGSLTRNDALLLLPLLALPVAMRGGPGRWRRLAVTCAVALAFLTPWLARNWITFDRPLVTTNYGQGLAGSNCHLTYYGEELGAFSILCFRLEPERDEVDWSQDLARQGLRYASDHARRVPVVVAVRVLRGWGFYEPGSQLRIYNMQPWVQDVGIAFYYPLLALAAAGLIVLYRRREPLIPLLTPLIATTLVLGAYSGVTRYRHGAELAMVVLAAVALDALLRRWRERVG